MREKIWKKRTLENEIALTREKAFCSVLRVIVTLFVVRTPLRATVESGFLSARYTVQVVRLTPVEYLTYEIREIPDIKSFVGVDAHIGPLRLTFSRGDVGADDFAQPSGAPERYGCGTPLAGAVRPTAPQARRASFSYARCVGADASVRPPRRRRGTLFRIHRRFRFCSDTATVAPRAYFFLSCQKKVCKKEALDAK